MSDFLKGLAERGLDKEPAIRPRLPALFEPSDAFGSPHFEPVEGEITEEVERVPVVSPLRPERRPSTEPLPPRRPTAESRQAETKRQLDGSGDSSQTPAQPPATDYRRPGPVETKPAAEKPAEPARPLETAPEKPAPIDFEPTVVKLRHTITRIFTEESGPTVSPPAPEKAAPPQTPPGESQSSSTEAPQPPPPTPQVVRPIRMADLDHPAVPAPEQAPADEAPTINVHIGRIEVRATPPPEKTTRRRAARPVMSLDEYMRRRREGGRK